MANVTIIVGAQWGDEGKGKWCDELAKDTTIIARYQGGNNAGHTLYASGKKIILHHLPSAIIQEGKKNAMLAGMVIDPVILVQEISTLRQLGFPISYVNLLISENAHCITPWHIFSDGQKELTTNQPLGTTKRGIGPTYSDKINRTGLRMGDYCVSGKRHEWIQKKCKEVSGFAEFYEKSQAAWTKFDEQAETLAPFITDANSYVRKSIYGGTSCILEGAQGMLLDIDHGTFPYVTSSSTTSGGACASLGLDPRKIKSIVGIAKAYVTRVGEGPFPTELLNDVGQKIRDKGQEYGSTTKRPRRCGWFDAVAMRYAVQVNGLDGIYLNKLDILSGVGELQIAYAYDHPTLGTLTDFPTQISVLKDCVPQYKTYPGIPDANLTLCRTFTDLPPSAKDYLAGIEFFSQTKLIKVGLGPERNQYV